MKVLMAIEDEYFGSDLLAFITTAGMPDDCQFYLLHVVPESQTGIFSAYSEDLNQTVSGAHRKYATDILRDMTKQLRQLYPNAQIKSDVLEGDPKTVILEVARVWHADKILVGSHGRNGFERLFLGSVSLAVLSQAPCPVTVVRALPSNLDFRISAVAPCSEAATDGSTAEVKDCQIHSLRKLRFVAYIRPTESEQAISAQRLTIDRYCAEHQHRVVGWFEERKSLPGMELANALRALEESDGLIVADLNKLVNRHDDRLIELRPLLSHLMQEKKVIVSVEEGLETLTGYGQEVVFTLLQDWSHPEPWPGLSPSKRQLT